MLERREHPPSDPEAARQRWFAAKLGIVVLAMVAGYVTAMLL